ncbi:phosphatidylserine lipase ABHD16A isoform X2 [Nematostella vectensis]|uniref:phosphatidylserine lipase ABHD16A isoform X2 n=1 Tax=Nematostella vectensis TaxID=45351 RepID=UPI0020774968|nr:phosphatidylserine lipase ABHD16A isoform X2 [Nematostella vectensis]
MADLVRCAFGPALYRIYSRVESRIRSRAYEQGGLEQCGEGVIKALSYAWSICYYTSPALGFYMFRKGIIYMSKYIGTAVVLLLGAYCIRGYGRYLNHDYREFLDILVATKGSNTDENKRRLGMYDFMFYEWPADYTWDEALRRDASEAESPFLSPSRRSPRGLTAQLLAFPCDSLRYLAAHSVGRPLMYPGSIRLLQAGLAEPILSGRTAFLEKGGKRAKLLAADGNHIDTMFVDKRGNISNKGETLVIACEGNAGFYELGLMSTPLKAGYSALGWNHPGFGGSTGLPFPSAEKNAIDVVVQYAVQKLGFPLESIFIYAWSIGGFSACYAAMTYPQLGGLVLDAAFDDIVPLAQSKMPEVLSGFITQTVREYFNLNNIKYLYGYSGPVLVVRRMRDEIITVVEGDISTNLGNILLVKLLKHRYPNLLDREARMVLDEFLAAPEQNIKLGLWTSMNVDVEECNLKLKEYTEQHGKTFPMKIGHDMPPEKRIHMLMFLVLQHLMDFDAAHCIPLPSTEFRLPWKIAS